MVLENDHYAYRVTWVDEDSEYVGLCLEYPSLSWLDESPETALMGIRKVVHDVVEDMIERNEQIPTTLATRKYSGSLWFEFLLKHIRHLPLKLLKQE